MDLKKTKKNVSFDYMRAFSALMIVCCHICIGFGLSYELGYYLGGTFVDCFIMLSAYLLGLSSRDKISGTPGQFLKRRISKIVPTYYIFLLMTFGVIAVMIGPDTLSLCQVTGHCLFLNWFVKSTRIDMAPLPQMGHLWFMSCIMLGYLIAVVASQMKNVKWLGTTKMWCVALFVFVVSASLITMKYRFFIYPCTVFGAFIFIFFKGPEIMRAVYRIYPWVLILLLVAGNIAGISFYMAGGYDYPVLVFWINFINAFMWIACTPIVFNTQRIQRSVLFISAISFEIYLIHHPFCMGAFSLTRFFPVWGAVVMVFLTSIVGGYLLSLVTSAALKACGRLKRMKILA